MLTVQRQLPVLFFFSFLGSKTLVHHPSNHFKPKKLFRTDCVHKIVLLLGCNKGGAGGIYLNYQISSQHQNFIFHFCLVFGSSIAGFWKRRNFSPELILPTKARTHICPCSRTGWNIQENLDSDLFWAGDSRF